MSEFEATLIRQRSIEAIHQKARRGESDSRPSRILLDRDRQNREEP